ncbi:hypothetical protein BDP27DRAFT_1361536 [Rhodocollybia butyracea]|uniref:Secreted protein n=1 Tax=Rhodocollybia butyracea TaxID=206335 RepID=A0A9P5PZ42_9AGAR|nr:hypothetical protein BDP27DRAFT_1361536 [Rhodocollybia butyracea]
MATVSFYFCTFQLLLLTVFCTAVHSALERRHNLNWTIPLTPNISVFLACHEPNEQSSTDNAGRLVWRPLPRIHLDAGHGNCVLESLCPEMSMSPDPSILGSGVQVLAA